MHTLSVQSTHRTEFLDLTARLKEFLRETKASSGALLVFNPHTTAGLTINEGADPDVQRDLLTSLARLIPERGDYHHGEGNSDAHLKASLMGSSVLIPLQEGRLVLGTWQSVYFCEFDGPRSRQVQVQIIR